MINYYCTKQGCNGLLIKAPTVLLMSPPIHQYQCLRCSKQCRLTDGEDKFWSDENTPQGKYLFEMIEFKSVQWQLRKKDAKV